MVNLECSCPQAIWLCPRVSLSTTGFTWCWVQESVPEFHFKVDHNSLSIASPPHYFTIDRHSCHNPATSVRMGRPCPEALKQHTVPEFLSKMDHHLSLDPATSTTTSPVRNCNASSRSPRANEESKGNLYWRSVANSSNSSVCRTSTHSYRLPPPQLPSLSLPGLVALHRGRLSKPVDTYMDTFERNSTTIQPVVTEGHNFAIITCSPIKCLHMKFWSSSRTWGQSLAWTVFLSSAMFWACSSSPHHPTRIPWRIHTSPGRMSNVSQVALQPTSVGYTCWEHEKSCISWKGV